MPNLIGRNIGRYHLLEQLGMGGMATVYKAFDTRLERLVAIKVIRRDAFPAEQLDRVLNRFDREAKTLAQLTHPNIVGIIDYGDFNGSPYLVMEFLPGGTLKQRLGKPVPYRTALQLLLPVAEALVYAHQKGVIHRDVKPANLLITEGGQPMLTDFGIAKLLEDDGGVTLTGTGVGVGTPEYMAPEQGMGREIDGRADVYALGVVLYELVTGRKPYTADTPMAVIFKHLTDPLPRPKLVVPELPERIEQIIFKALAKKPEDRYASMAEFAKAMSEWREGLPRSGGDVSAATGAETPVEVDETGEATVDLGTGTPAAAQAVETEGIATIDSGSSSPERATIASVVSDEEKPQITTSRSRNRRDGDHSKGSDSPKKMYAPEHPQSGKMHWLRWVFVVAGLVIVGTIVWGTGRSDLAPATAETTPMQTQVRLPDNLTTQTVAPAAEMDPTPIPSGIVITDAQGNSVLRLEDGKLYQVAYSPDGEVLAVASSIGIFLYDAETLKRNRFINTGTDVKSIAFSPDGGILASGLTDKKIKLWNVESGALLPRTFMGWGFVGSVTFSPDGRLFASGQEYNVFLWDAGNYNMLHQMDHSGNCCVLSVAFSPGGNILASGSGGSTIKLWDTESGELLDTLHGHTGTVRSVAFSPYGRRLASGSGDKTIRLWHVESGAPLQTLEGHNAGVNSVTFSPDGRILASGSMDKTIKLWDTTSGALLQTLEGHTDSVKSVAFSPDGRRLASASLDGTIRIWDISEK